MLDAAGGSRRRLVEPGLRDQGGRSSGLVVPVDVQTGGAQGRAQDQRDEGRARHQRRQKAALAGGRGVAGRRDGDRLAPLAGGARVVRSAQRANAVDRRLAGHPAGRLRREIIVALALVLVPGSHVDRVLPRAGHRRPGQFAARNLGEDRRIETRGRLLGAAPIGRRVWGIQSVDRAHAEEALRRGVGRQVRFRDLAPVHDRALVRLEGCRWRGFDLVTRRLGHRRPAQRIAAIHRPADRLHYGRAEPQRRDRQRLAGGARHAPVDRHDAVIALAVDRRGQAILHLALVGQLGQQRDLVEGRRGRFFDAVAGRVFDRVPGERARIGRGPAVTHGDPVRLDQQRVQPQVEDRQPAPGFGGPVFERVLKLGLRQVGQVAANGPGPGAEHKQAFQAVQRAVMGVQRGDGRLDLPGGRPAFVRQHGQVQVDQRAGAVDQAHAGHAQPGQVNAPARDVALQPARDEPGQAVRRAREGVAVGEPAVHRRGPVVAVRRARPQQIGQPLADQRGGGAFGQGERQPVRVLDHVQRDVRRAGRGWCLPRGLDRRPPATV